MGGCWKLPWPIFFFISPPCCKKGSGEGVGGAGLWNMRGIETYHLDMKALLAFSHLLCALKLRNKTTPSITTKSYTITRG